MGQKLSPKQRNNIIPVIKNLHNLHKQSSATANMLLKTFKSESCLQRCAFTVLIFYPRYASDDTVILKSFLRYDYAKNFYFLFFA